MVAAGGGVATPMLAQPRQTKRMIVLVGFILMVTLYITFYEVEEEAEEEFAEVRTLLLLSA